MSNGNLQVGEAAEMFVMYKLMRMGYNVTACTQFGTYDLVVDVDNAPVRVQVKATERIMDGRAVYRFSTCKGGKTKTAYDAGDFDIAAYVILDREQIVFEPHPHTGKLKSMKPETFTDTSYSDTWKLAVKRKPFMLLPSKALPSLQFPNSG